MKECVHVCSVVISLREIFELSAYFFALRRILQQLDQLSTLLGIDGFWNNTLIHYPHLSVTWTWGSCDEQILKETRRCLACSFADMCFIRSLKRRNASATDMVEAAQISSQRLRQSQTRISRRLN